MAVSERIKVAALPSKRSMLDPIACAKKAIFFLTWTYLELNKAKGLLCSKGPICTLSQNGYGVSLRVTSLYHSAKGASTFDRNMVLSKRADARSQLTSAISPLRGSNP